MIGKAIEKEETDILVKYVSGSKIVAQAEPMYEQEEDDSEEEKKENANPNQGESD